MRMDAPGFRLSPQQRRLWLRQQDGVFRAQCSLLLSGSLDGERLQQAVRRVVARHEILRTRLVPRPGLKTPLQVVAAKDEPVWRKVDLGDSRSHLDLCESLMEEALPAPDPKAGSPLRVTLASLAPDRHLLLLSLPALHADA